MQPEPLIDSQGALTAGQPFSRSMAQAAGIHDHQLRTGIRRGDFRNLLRGVYVANSVPDTESLRFAAVRVALQTTPEALVVGETAAWLHGVWPQLGNASVDRARSQLGYQPREISVRDDVRLTGPTRTAIDLAIRLPLEQTVACWDGLFRDCGLTRNQILQELPRFARDEHRRRLSSALALVDDRSGSIAESLLRVAWLGGQLPTPVPGLEVTVGSVRTRLGLALPAQQFGVVISGKVPAEDLAALRHRDWMIVEVGARQVEAARAETLRRMLVGQYHRTLLSRVEPASA